mmetsp:Transcript_79629/g.209146  ORF Transcript_79629/g.209146 Transcript_79629/m.209146 type:complete len:210 (+) Transcript_79629:793-1422(+)
MSGTTWISTSGSSGVPRPPWRRGWTESRARRARAWRPAGGRGGPPKTPPRPRSARRNGCSSWRLSRRPRPRPTPSKWPTSRPSSAPRCRAAPARSGSSWSCPPRTRSTPRSRGGPPRGPPTRPGWPRWRCAPRSSRRRSTNWPRLAVTSWSNPSRGFGRAPSRSRSAWTALTATRPACCGPRTWSGRPRSCARRRAPTSAASLRRSMSW